MGREFSRKYICLADLIDAAWVLGGGDSFGDTGSGGYTTFAYENGAGKGATITPARGDTSKRFFAPNAGRRSPNGSSGAYGSETQLGIAIQRSAANAYLLLILDVDFAAVTWGSKLEARPLRCVRS